LRAYFRQTIEGIESGLFSFLAHPELVLADGMEWNGELKALFSDLIDAAIAQNMPLEINGYGIIKKRVPCPGGSRYPYPVDEFWELAAQKGARIICNSDAHTPDYVIQGVLNAQKYAARLGLRTEGR
jgi:histidinol-phosphatase (PHP family)